VRGVFITFEGGDGTGKSTQIKRLTKRLLSQGLEVETTREPGGSERAETIREFLLAGKAKHLGPVAETVLFAAARMDHVDALIRPALARGRWVLCDRFIDSTRVYQGIEAAVPTATIDALERLAVGDTLPDLTLILDLPAQAGLERARKRMIADGAVEPDRFEGDALKVHKRRRTAFLELAKTDPDRYRVIDTTGAAGPVAQEIWNVVAEKFALVATKTERGKK
jgi:dTMP kinase